MVHINLALSQKNKKYTPKNLPVKIKFNIHALYTQFPLDFLNLNGDAHCKNFISSWLRVKI